MTTADNPEQEPGQHLIRAEGMTYALLALNVVKLILTLALFITGLILVGIALVFLRIYVEIVEGVAKLRQYLYHQYHHWRLWRPTPRR